MTSSPLKIRFLHNLGLSFYIWGQIEAVFNILKCSKWPPFWARDQLLTGSYSGSWIYQKDSQYHFRRLELLIDALAQILPEIYQCQNLTNSMTCMVTSSMTSWIRIYINIVIISWYLRTGSVIMIYLVVFFIMTNVVISFIKEYRGPTLRPSCDVIDNIIVMKNTFLAWFGTVFSYLRSNWSCD